MLIHLHIGIDKAGSSAIQAHLILNRDWFHKKGIFIPITGRSHNGYEPLFRDLSEKKFADLNQELKAAENLGFQNVFMSWEGISYFTREGQLEPLKAMLKEHDFKIYAYLREQSEVIQTGYFQQVKTNALRLNIDDFHGNLRLLNPASRNYAVLLDRFEKAFSLEALNVRVFDRDLLNGNNVVIDMLDMLGLECDENFTIAPVDHNLSLDLVSVKILNMLDLYYENDSEGRRRFVDALLNDIAVRGGVGKYFLTREDCDHIKDVYAESNRQVVARYIGEEWPHSQLFTYKKETFLDVRMDVVEAAIPGRLDAVAALNSHWTWNGTPLEGKAVESVAQLSDGWAHAENWGVWATNSTCHIRFRMQWLRRDDSHNKLCLAIRGNYHVGYQGSRVFVKDRCLGEFDLSQAEIEIPLADIHDYGLVDIRFEHRGEAPDDPSSKDPKPVFALLAVSYITSQ